MLSIPAFAGSTGYFNVGQPLPSAECTSLVLYDCNRTVGDGSACREINNHLRELKSGPRTRVSEMKDPACKKVGLYTASFLTCSDILTKTGQDAVRKQAATEMSGHPDDVSDVRKCMHSVNDLNYSSQMNENIKQLFADTEGVSSPVANGSAPDSDLIKTISIRTAKEN